MNTIVPKLAVIEANNGSTERTLAPAERLKVRERLSEAAKMEAIGRFVLGIAHDFNNVLAGILAYAELLHDQLPEQSRQKGHAENVLTAVARGRALVDQMLAYGRREVGEREPIDLVRIVAETLDLLHGTLPPHVALDWRPPVSRLMVIANATELHRVVMNLCCNAIHALGAGGILRVALAVSDVSAPRGLSHGRLSDGCYACLTVEDTGCGMDDATLARIFEPFFTTKKAGRGTGLGLSLVHAIVTDLAGAIDVKSSAGRGTTLAVYLPLRFLRQRSGEFAVDETWSAPASNAREPEGMEPSTVRLSARERAIVLSMAHGLSNKKIARQLSIAPETVKSHAKSIFWKLTVQTRAQAVRRAAALGLI